MFFNGRSSSIIDKYIYLGISLEQIWMIVILVIGHHSLSFMTDLNYKKYTNAIGGLVCITAHYRRTSESSL
jgi:hypothetical protein